MMMAKPMASDQLLEHLFEVSIGLDRLAWELPPGDLVEAINELSSRLLDHYEYVIVNRKEEPVTPTSWRRKVWSWLIGE